MVKQTLAVVAAACLAATSNAEVPPGYPSVEMVGLNKEKMQMPLYGLGTWQYNDSRTEDAVVQAFSLGYRHVDTAALYNNLKGVGSGLKKTGLKREEYFVTSKIPGGLNASAAEALLVKSMKELDLDYVDLMLIHFPMDLQGKGSPAARQELWGALQNWALTGQAKAIGVSHYCQHHVEDILKVTKVPISVNQVQYHVGMGTAPDTATDDKAWMQKQGILYQSFSPLCGPCNAPDNTELLNGTLVTSIGKAHNKTGPQVALRWLVQQGIPVIPKSDRVEHLKENAALFDFELTKEEMDKLTAATKPAVGGGPSPTDSGDCSITGDEEALLVV
mmetsp:Transcript_25198/g.38323  ORF Transcript_25198/g.38323 Transcript_25198/m.38323 type:complete len:332 (+) Transcript_25198:58-1053(+)|eukprot:CAMPEP_0206464672 /NCGR_PEP_ID=MMETSP0324_2-20121206/27354_1 /ASSEMBLY_ACC=CAM_ASM_000836 /TAXON_ID=2866 /ORGANISM="Crypthecodinium cohnii, Strain Seligo" /LENGTH=331 /DNA_ID=CAMNT_0053937345 /DNA_START=68 /DNA_END=1063 /DNA_ORIENTATION=-